VNVRFLLGFLGVVCLNLSVAWSQSASFEIAQHGHAVGTASYSFTSSAQGYSSTSLVRVAMQGLNYNLSKNEALTAASHLRHVQLSATVNGSAVTVTAKPGNGQILLNTSANGRSSTSKLAQHAGAVFLPDFDAGALETLLTLAVQQNNRALWAIIPKRAGSIVPVQLATYADLHGTMNGRAVTVHHLVATIQGAKTELFSGAKNELLQAELPQQGFALVRKGFVLQPPSKAPAAPAQPQSAPAQKTPSAQ
jgi:hypothetical protein